MNLENYKKKSGFTVPDGYFEKLESEIKRATCHKSAEPEKKKTIFTGFMRYAAMIAIVFAAAAGIIYNYADAPAAFFTNNSPVAEMSNALEDNEYIGNMLAEYPIDEYTFYCYMTDSDNY